MPVPLQPTLGRPNQAPLFCAMNSIGSAAEAGPLPRSNFNEYQCGAIAHHQIQFPDTITEVTSKQDQALTDQIVQCAILGLASMLLRCRQGF